MCTTDSLLTISITLGFGCFLLMMYLLNLFMYCWSARARKLILTRGQRATATVIEKRSTVHPGHPDQASYVYQTTAKWTLEVEDGCGVPDTVPGRTSSAGTRTLDITQDFTKGQCACCAYCYKGLQVYTENERLFDALPGEGETFEVMCLLDESGNCVDLDKCQATTDFAGLDDPEIYSQLLKDNKKNSYCGLCAMWGACALLFRPG